MMDSEHEIDQYLKKMLKPYKAEVIKFHSQYSTSWPDRQILLPGGRFWWVELKKKGKTPNKFQQLRGKWLIENGFNYVFLDSKNAVNNFIINEIHC